MSLKMLQMKIQPPPMKDLRVVGYAGCGVHFGGFCLWLGNACSQFSVVRY